MIGVAVVGYGYWGPILLRNIARHPGLEALHVCDHTLSKAQGAREFAPEVKCSTTIDSVLDNPDVDLVVIATQAATHFALADTCLRAGKHVLLEKPFCLSLEDATNLVRLAEQVDRRLFEDKTFLHTAAYSELRRWIQDGSLGAIRHYYSMRADFGLFQRDANVVWHLLYHDLYMLADLFCEQGTEVCSAFGSIHVFDEVHDTVSVELAVGSFDVSLNAHMLYPRKVRDIFVAGERGILYWDDTAEDKLRFYDKCAEVVDGSLQFTNTPDPQVVAVDQSEAVWNEFDEIYKVLSERTAPSDALTVSLGAVKMAERITQMISSTR